MIHHLTRPEWWACYFFDLSSGDTDDFNELLDAGLGVSDSQALAYWDRELAFHAGPTHQSPKYSIAVGDYQIDVDYVFDPPSHEITYSHSVRGMKPTIWAIRGGNAMLPGFRWSEIKQFAQRSNANLHHALLLLSPACEIESGDLEMARADISESLTAIGFDHALCPEFVGLFVESLAYQNDWYNDPEFGWITHNLGSYRCRDRPDRGLWIPEDQDFLTLKELFEASEGP